MLLKSRLKWIEKGDERGMAIVEMSLVAMAFFALVIGILDVGRAVYTYNTLSAVTRDACRHAIVHGNRSSSPATSTSIQTYVRNKLPGFSGVTASTTWDPNNRQGSKVTVTVQYTYTPIVALFPSANLTASSEMAMSY